MLVRYNAIMLTDRLISL